MGRQNPEWYHQIVINVSVQAPDENEALDRFRDIRDALQARFNGMDIYPPRPRGQTGSARIAGNPRFLDFVLADVQPTSVLPFSDTLEEGARRRSPHNEVRPESSDLLITVAHALARIVEKGLIPEDPELESIAEELRQFTGIQPSVYPEA